MMSPSLLSLRCVRSVGRALGLAFLSLALLALSARPALADPHTEAAARDAQTKAQAEYASANYEGAANRLQAALRGCAPARCSPAVRAALLRDLGVMQFRTGDKDGAGKSFADALALQQTITLDPSYDASDVGAAFEDQRAIAGLPAGPVSAKPPPGAKGGAATTAPAAPGGAGGPPAAPLGEQPSGGDFAHEPALEQRENTPLPIYAEYAGASPLAHVVVKYKGAQMREWLRVQMHKEGTGWAALIPCADVTRGVMHYWIQAFDRSGEPVAASGDPKHPFYVPIREKLTGEAPHLPGKEPPRPCDDTDCPPGIAGCKAKGEGPEGGAAPGAGAGAAGGAEGEAAAAAGGKAPGLPAGAYPRIWVGASFAMDFV
ncbi:MAG: hypothetical protein JOZ69_25175, partial [Myxococcales bacterium]|nr:hypothetical protein [Myxococcales bacterium]